MEKEFETRILLLGQDIGYMGLRVQKDTQKCLKDLRANQDHKRFCGKLADVLKRFSEFTVQYSRDLEGRITEYQKNGDYNEIIQKLQEIGGVQKAACNVCKSKGKGAETSNSLGPPGNNEEESTELTKNENPDEVLSQYSLHIGNEDEVKSEQLTEIQSPLLQNDRLTNDLSDITEPHSTQLKPNDVDVDSSIINSHNNDTISEQEYDHNDTDIANSLEISHSEDVLSNEDQEEVICLSDAPNMMIEDQSEATKFREGQVCLEQVAEDNNHDKSQKHGVIPLPYKPLFEKEEQSVPESTKSKDSDVLQKMNVIALPYKPLFERVEEPAQESSCSNEKETRSSSTKDEPTVKNKKNEILADDNDNADDEIVSVASSHEDSDSDVEIIENIPPSIVLPNQSTQNGFNSKTIPNDSPRSTKAAETQNTDNIFNTDAETVKGTSSEAIDLSDTVPYDASSEETIVNEATLPELHNVDSDVETEKNTSPRSLNGFSEETVVNTVVQQDPATNIDFNDALEVADVVENDEGHDEWDIETVANTLSQPEEGSPPRRDNVLGIDNSDAATVTYSPTREPNDSICNQAVVDASRLVTNAGEPGDAVPLVTCDDIISSIGTYSQETNVNHSSAPEKNANDSDDTIVASPLNPAMLTSQENDKTADESEKMESEEDSTLRANKDDKTVSESEDNIYTKTTQRSTNNTKHSVGENDDDDDDDVDYDAPTQVVLHKNLECRKTSDNMTPGPCAVDTKEDDDAPGYVNDALIGLPREKVAEIIEEAQEDGKSQETLTQDIDISESPAVVEAEDVIVESDDTATQGSYVFNLEENRDSEEITQETLTETIEEKERNNQSNKDSQESFVFDIEKEPGDCEVSSTINTPDKFTAAVESSVAPPDDKNDHSSTCDDVQEDDNLSIISEFGSGISGSNSDIDGTSKKSKRKLKDKDRKSLLKVIADFFSKRKKVQEAAKNSINNEDKEENKKGPKTTTGNKQSRKNTPVKGKGSAEIKNQKTKNIVRKKREKNTSASKKGDREAKEYLDFLNARRIDEAGDSSAESVRDDVIIQEDGFDSSDVENTQIENGRESPTKKTLDENSEKDGGDLQSEKTIEASKSDDGDSDDSEELFKSSQTGPESTRKSPVRSINDSIAQLPVKASLDASNNAKDLEDLDEEDPDRTQKVDDLRKLRRSNEESVDTNGVVDHPIEKVCSRDATEGSRGNVEQDIQDKQSNEEENDDSQVVIPFKRKVVRPLPSTQSDGEDAPNRETQDDDMDNQVVSPFKKKIVKRLHSSDESDSEPPKKIVEAGGTQESDGFDCSTHEIVKPFKRTCVKRLLSTEDEASDATQKASDNDGSEIEFGGAKRRKVQRLSSSSAELMATGENKRVESRGAQTETEKDPEILEENDHHIEPSQFKLDDKARDEFLDMFDREHSSGSERDCAIEEPVDVERDENSENEDYNEIESGQFKLGDGDRDNLLNLLTDKENEERDANNEEGRVDSPSLLRNDSESREDRMSSSAEPPNTSSKRDDDADQPSQFKLNSKDRDEFLELLNGEPSDHSRDQDEQRDDDCDGKKTKSDSGQKTVNKDGKAEANKGKEHEDVNTIEPNGFNLNAKARDEFLDLLNGCEPNNDSTDQDDQQNDNSGGGKKTKSDSGQKTPNEDGKAEVNKCKEDEDVDKIEPNEFNLNAKARDEFLDLLNGSEPSNQLDSAARNELLEMLNNEQGGDSIAKDDEQEGKNLKKDTNTREGGLETDNDKLRDEFIEPSQFKLNDQARDEFLEMLSSDKSDNSGDNKNGGNDKVPRLENDKTDQAKETLNYEDTPNDRDMLQDQDQNIKDTPNDKDAVEDQHKNIKHTPNDKNTLGDQDNCNDKDEDDFDDTVTENSQGIDDVDESDSEENELKDETTAKSLQFKLDEHEEDELMNLLSDHFKKTEKDSDADSSGSDKASDTEFGVSRRKKKSKKVKKVDKDMLLELLKEFENTVKDKVENGDMEFDHMDGDHGDAKSDFHEESGADSDSVLMDLLREEAVEMPEEGGRRKKKRDTSKAAWNAYHELLKDTEELSDDSSSEISDIDIDDLELDLSDQERRQKERALDAVLKKRFNIDKELIVDVEQTDVSSFDLSSLSRREAKMSSKIDRLCDISNVLQKRKKREKARRKLKVPRLSPSVRSSVSDSENDSVSSSPSYWSDDSLRAKHDSTGNRDSYHLSDDNVEQDKLANALWENIKNSSDDNSGWSSDDDTDSSDEDKRKGKKGGGGGGSKNRKGKREESDDEEEDGTDDDNSSSEKSGDENDVGGESGDKEKKEKDLKDADLDSSDEDDFVGVRKGAWKLDPLLKGCLSSDESDFESDSSLKKARINARVKRKMKKIQGEGDGSNEKSDAKKDGSTIPTEDIISSDTDSDVEFVMEKNKTPKKLIVIEDEAEDDSPSKTGKGRRNIRALVEDDELAEATKKAKKEETERIKRLQEREKAKETFSQSQSFGSQLSEDEGEPLFLDVNEELQIKVHPKITKKLKPHQRSGIQFMWDSCYESVEQLKKGYEGSGCILAHCMGLGKTLQALGLIHTVFNYKQVTKAKHVLVVCPLSTVSNWRNEFKLAYKDIRHCNIQLFTIEDKKVAKQRFSIVKKWWKNGGILVMGYECFGLLTNDQKLEKMAKKIFCNKDEMLEALVNPGPDLVICDEGHLLRNKQTQRNLSLNKVKTKRRVVLTGTPLQNNLLEYYYMVHFVKPNLLGTEKEFKTNFINPISNGQFENSTAVDILFMKKRTHVLHKILNKTVQRVEDTELKRYLPELVDQALFVKLSDLQVQFYNTYLDGANARPVEYTAAGNISRKSFLGDIQVLRYICTHPDVVTIAKRSVKSKIKEQDVIDDMDDAIEEKFFSKSDWFKELVPESGVKQPELGTKMMMALGIVEEAIAANDKVLIFSQTHAEMDSLEFFLKEKLNFKKAFDYNRMDGTISPEVRTHMCDTFNDKKNKRLRVFIMSTKVGGLGLNLTAANRVIIMNVNWNPSYDTQSVFRAFRFGQEKAVYVYRLIAIDTMEEKMYQRQVTKLAVAHRVVDKHQITRHYSAADIQEFYSVRPTTQSERPLPNVPEDRVLAKLIQKFQFLYKWHEHQALLANRPEEDLNEQQKNAAWEEFNKRAVEPPPPVPGLPPPMPHFVSVSSILNQPGPSGIQNRLNAGLQPYPRESSNGHFADHNYSLPKTNPIAPQRINSADDFRTPLPKYVPRPLFVDVTAPLGPRPNLSGLPPGQKNRSATTTSNQPAAKPVQNQPTTKSAPTQVRLGSAITLTQNNGAKSNPPPAHAQKPSISIIPQPASSRAVSNVTATKPPPYVPKNATVRVQNPLNLVKNLNLNQNLGKNLPIQPSNVANMLQKVQNQVNLLRSKNAANPQANKIAQKIITPPPPRRVAAPLSRVVAPTPPIPPQLNKILVPPPLSLLTAGRAPPTSDPLFIPITTTWTNTSSTMASTTTTSIATPSNQQSPLQKQMRNFMEHLHQLQQKMKDTDEEGGPNLGDSNNGRVWNSTGNNNQGTPANMNTSRIIKKAAGPPFPPRTIVKVGPKPLSPVIGGPGTANVTRLNAARNLSNITKTYQRAKDSNVAGVTTPATSQSSANRPNVRVIGTHPSPIIGANTPAPTSRVVLPNNISSIVHTNGASPKVVQKIVTNSPKGAAARNIVINNGGLKHNASGTTVINPVVGQTTIGTVPRVITRVVGSNAARAKPKVNPVRINGNVGKNAPQASSMPGMSGRKKILISDTGGIQQNSARVQNPASPIRVDLLQKKMMTNLNRLSTKKLPPQHISTSPQLVPKPLPHLPQRSFVNSAGMRTYEARKNTPPSRATSLPSLSISQSGVSVSKSNKENRTNRKLSFVTNNNTTSTDNSTVDLSNEDNSGNTTGGSISKDMVNTLRKKGVSINYLGKDVINLD